MRLRNGADSQSPWPCCRPWPPRTPLPALYHTAYRPSFPENDGYYAISKGNCSLSACSDRRPDLDVDVEVLASVLFSSAGAGEIFDLPTSRYYMALMLDI